MGTALVASLLTSAAFAQDDSTRAAARTLGTEGVEAFESRDYPSAEKKLKQAYSVLKVPSLALWLARARVQTGHLVEAAELYLEATRLDVSGSQADVQRQAQADAATEREALLPRIPSIVIQVEGAKASELQIELDGVSIPSGLIGAKRPTDPGAHVVSVRRGERTEKRRFNLPERANQNIAFDFARAAAAPTTETEAAPPATPESAATPHAAVPTKPASTQRTLGWVSLGLGGAGAIVGGVFGLIAVSQKDSLDKQCPHAECGPRSYGDVDSYDHTRLVSTAGFIVGAVGVAAGITLLVTAPRAASPDQVSLQLQLRLGPGHAALHGAF